MSSSREETRGLFVLSVIAILLVLHYDQSLIQNPLAAELVNILLLFWGGYAVLTIVGLSDDIFGKRISKVASLIGLFALGCAVGYCVSFTLLYFLVSPVINLLLPIFFAPQHFHNLLEAIVGIFAVGLGLLIIVSVFGLMIALYVPPILVAWGMSRTYGRKIWLICAGVIVLLTASLLIH